MADYFMDLNGNVTKKETKKKEEKKKSYDYFRNPDGSITRKERESGSDTWFKKGAFEDGYQFGDVTKSVGATLGDAALGVVQGAGNMVEGVVDLGMYGVAGVSDLVGADSFADDVRNVAKKSAVNDSFGWVRDNAFENSLLGDKSVGVAQGVGQAATMILTAGAGSAAGLGSAGASALSTGTMFASSAGSGMSEAYESGASDEDALKYGLMKGGVDAVSEMIFGGLGKTVNALGISRGISSLDDILAKKLSEKMGSKAMKLLTQYSVKSAGEGLEEVLAGLGSAAAKKLTYMSDTDLKQLVKDENLMDQFISGTLTSAIMQGGDAIHSASTGQDFVTGMTKNEELVVEAEAKKRIAEREAEGKLSNKEKNAIYDQVKSDLAKGYIGIDTIESVLGGESYKVYKDVSDREDALVKEFEELGKKQNATLAEQARYAKLEQQIEELKGSSEKLKLKEQLSQRVSELAKGDRLAESYNEKMRRSQAYTANLTKYGEKQQAVVKAAVESGILNNTNRTHEFVDMIAKIAADKGVSFDFTNNQKLRDSGFALEGKTVNGFLKDGNISLNIESAKALNTVVGHEITHVLEGTELYGELQQAVKMYAESKGEYGKRLEALQKLYEGVEGANIENELTADLIGDYLFTDSDFVNRLSTEKPGLFKRIFEEIKYLVKTATAGSKQARELEKVKRTFEKAYKESGTTANADGKTKYSVNSKFYEQLDTWDGETIGFSFVVGETSEALQEAGIPRKQIRWDASKIATLLKKHSGMTRETVKGIPELLENPVIVIDSKKGDNSKIVMGELYDENGKVVTAVLLLTPTSKKGNVLDLVKISSAEGRSHISSLFTKEDGTPVAVRYVDKKRIQNWLNVNRLQLPLHNHIMDSNDIIPQNEENATKNRKYSFSGVNARTSDASQLEIARQMEENGAMSEEIRKVTGWHRGYDNKWRFEIDDSEMTINDVKSNYTTLSKLIKHDKLFEAYPELEDVSVVFQDLDSNGSFNARFFQIDLNRELKKDKNELRRTLSHEIQHAIQRIEGFETGSTEKYWEERLQSGYDSRKKTIKQEEAELVKQYYAIYEENPEFFEEMEDLIRSVPDMPRGEINWETLEEIEEDPIEWQRFDARRDALEEKYGREKVWDFMELSRKKEALKKDEGRTAYDLYYATAGEIEARETAKRVDFSKEQRKQTEPKGKRENLVKDDVVFSGYSLGDDIAPPIGNNVYGKDIALEEIAPVQQNIPISEDIGPVGKTAGEPLKDIGPVRDDIVSQEIPTTEENAPVGQEYSPDELPTWGEVKKAEEDTYAPEPESYPKKKVTTVKERNAAKLQSLKVQLKNEQDLMEKSHASYNAEIRDLQSEYEKTLKDIDDVIHELQYAYDKKKNKTTKTAQELLDRIERRKRTRDRVERELLDRIESRKNSRDNTDAFYEKRVHKIKKKIDKMNTKEFKIVEQRMSKEEEYQTMFGDLIGDTSTWVDKKMGIYYKVNTLRRNLRDIVRDENGNRDIAKADAIYDELQGKYNHNEAKLNREANEIRGRYAELKITAEEDAYIQMLGEYRHNPDTTLTADVMKEYYEKHKAKIDTKKVDKIIASARQLYDELFRRVNATLEEQGMRPIEYREGYFPHFTDDKQSWLAKLLNWKTRKDEIPTDIAGLTEQFKPVRSYQSFDKHRTGDSTDYSFKKGLDMYVQGALDWIYHIEDIQKRRAFENEIRYRHSDQGVKDKVEAIRNNPEYDASEVQDQIDLVYKEARNPLNNFIVDFRTQTNTLAGKKHSMDRGMESDTNRKFYSTMQNISNRVTANMVVGSFSSALTNFIPITQSWAEVSLGSSLLAMRDTIKSYIKKDSSAVDNSDFLTNRLRKSKKLYQSTWDKAIDKFGFMMEAVDNFTSQVVWRSKYLENMNAGMSENEAIKNADQFAENVMAGRSRGNNPTIFDAKNPFIKIATAFQLEVNNQYGYLFKDVPQELRNEVKGKLVAGYAKVFIGAWFYNMAYSALTGRDAALDPIGIIGDLLKDLGFGDDEEPEEPAEIIGNLAESVAEELPFIGGLLGGGRIPISSALPYDDSDGVVGALRDFSEDAANWKDGGLKNIGKELSNPASYLLLPAGGGQIRKTLQGLGMYSDKHPIAGSYTKSGKLRFAVEDTPLSKLQAALFGQWSSKNAREYIEEGRSPLGEKQTQELVDTGLPMADYWKYRDGLKEQSGTQEKIEYIAGLDLPIDTKNILVNNAVERKTPVDLTEYDNLSGYGEFDFFSKNKELYNFLKENGVSYWDYKILGEDVQDEYKALQKDSRKQKFLKENGVSVSTYCGFSKWEKDAYDWAYKNPEKYRLSQVITKDVVEYKRFTAAINNLESDKDATGKTISGSKKKKVERYINGLNIDYGQKLILFRSLYESDDTYNYEIVEYLNGRDDISRTEMESILESLGFTVHSDGRVTW